MDGWAGLPAIWGDYYPVLYDGVISLQALVCHGMASVFWTIKRCPTAQTTGAPVIQGVANAALLLAVSGSATGKVFTAGLGHGEAARAQSARNNQTLPSTGAK